VTPVFYKIWF